MKSAKYSSGNVVVIVLVIIVIIIALGYIVFKAILPKFTSQLGSQIASKAIELSVEQLKNMDFSKAETEEINQPVPNSELSLVSIGFNKGKLTIDDKSTSNSITGQVKYLGLKPTTSKGSLMGIDAITIKSSDQMGEDSTIHLPMGQPLYLQIGIGIGIATIDLTNLTIEQANIAAGGGEITIIVPKQTSSNISVAAGAGTLKIGTHTENGVRIIAAPGISLDNIELNKDRYIKIEGGFVSTNYDSAPVKTEIVIGQTGQLQMGDIK